MGFIREEKHPDWLANIASVTKKNGRIRVCIDFRDLNNAFPKDEFPVPITEIMIDNTCGYEKMSFMDGGITKSKWIQTTKGTRPLELHSVRTAIQ